MTIVLETAQEFVPGSARKRSAVDAAQPWTDLVLDGRTPVITCGGEWGSIPFYLGRTDIVLNCGLDVPAKDIIQFVSGHSRYVPVVRRRQDLAFFRSLLPAHGTITTIRDAGEIQVTLVEDGRGGAK